jgi:hypothetical protein
MTDPETIARLHAIDDHARALESTARAADHWPGGYPVAASLRLAAAWWRAMAERMGR